MIFNVVFSGKIPLEINLLHIDFSLSVGNVIKHNLLWNILFNCLIKAVDMFTHAAN